MGLFKNYFVWIIGFLNKSLCQCLRRENSEMTSNLRLGEEWQGSSLHSWDINAFHAAGECRRQVKQLINFVRKVKIVEFHDHIWNHNEKCIQISTNMPGIGSLIREIAVEISEMWESKQTFAQKNQAPRSKCYYNPFLEADMFKWWHNQKCPKNILYILKLSLNYIIIFVTISMHISTNMHSIGIIIREIGITTGENTQMIKSTGCMRRVNERWTIVLCQGINRNNK